MVTYAIYGANGCGRGVLPLARRQLERQGRGCNYELVFVDDSPPAPVVNEHRVISYSEFLTGYGNERFVSLAIADSATRERLATRCTSDGLPFFEVRAESTVVMDDCEIGVGAVLSPFVTLTSNIRIGRHFHANLYSYVEHDCIVGDFVTFAPGVKCNGNVIIEDHVYVGAGAILRQGRRGQPLVLGRGAVIGMGAVVTKSVPAGVTVIGNPARPMRR